MRFISLCLCLGLVLGIACTPDQASAQGPTVANVVAFDVNGNLPGFLELVQKAGGIRERAGAAGTVRVWQATLAGAETGSVVVVVEYADLAALAEANAKLAASEEWAAMVAEGQAAGFQIVSNSASVEITP